MPVEFEKGDKLERIEKHLDRPDVALTQIGALMVAESQRAFREQKFGDKVWQPRRVPNLFGIIADFAAGKREPPARRFESRPALQDTGRLLQSIAWRLVNTTTVEVGSTLPYAGTLHTGGEVESEPITEQVRTLLNAWLKGKGSAYRRKLGWVLNKKFAGKTLTAKVSARPIVGITRETYADVLEVVGVRIMEASH